MTKVPNLDTAKLDECVIKLKKRSLLEVLLYHSLIDEIEECLIIKKEPFLIKTYEEIEAYPELLSYSNFTPSLLTTDENSKFYFHLEGVEIEPNSKCVKKTAEDNMHGRIQLTVVYK